MKITQISAVEQLRELIICCENIARAVERWRNCPAMPMPYPVNPNNSPNLRYLETAGVRRHLSASRPDTSDDPELPGYTNTALSNFRMAHAAISRLADTSEALAGIRADLYLLIARIPAIAGGEPHPPDGGVHALALNARLGGDEFDDFKSATAGLKRAFATMVTDRARPTLTVAEIVQHRDVIETTVTRWARETNQPKPKGKYAIAESDLPSSWPLRSAKTPKPRRPALAEAVIWECTNCRVSKGVIMEVTSKTRPQRCGKCGRSAFTRKNMNPAAK